MGRRRVNLDVWAFETGEKFLDAVRKAISGSDLFVLFASHESLKSLWVKFETNEAEELLRSEVLKSSVTLVIDGTVSYSDLPLWMQRALVTPVTQPARAAQIIEAALNKIRGVREQPLFIGREEVLKDLSEKLIPEYGKEPPHIVIVGGLNGVGRKTFLKRGFSDFLSLGLAPTFVLQPTDDLEMLHFQLLDEVGETDSRADREAAIKRFRAADAQRRADYLAQMMLSLAKDNFAPAIVAEGALLDADGTYTAEARLLLTAIHRYANLFVAIIHGRRPAQSESELREFGAIYLRIPPLSLASTKRLLIQSAKTANLSLDTTQVEELSTYLDGYPPAVHLAISFAKEYGMGVLLADKSTLVDFKIHTFAKILETLKLNELEWFILRVLAENPVLSLEALSVMAQSSQEIVARQLRSLIDQNLVLPVDNDVQLAAPIRSAVHALKGFFTADEHTLLAARLKAAYWQQPHNELPPFEVINATVNAVLRSANSNTELNEFGSLVMPSVMYRVAKEHYDSGGEKGWEAAQQLLKRILDLVPNHKASLILLFKTHVRFNQWQPAEDVLNKIDAERFIERHYLRGFLLWKKRETAQAVSHFRNAMALGHHAVEVYHGLASALYELENLEEAEKVLRKGLEGRRRPNFVLWDLAAKIAILREQYQKAEEIIDELKRLGEDEDYHHRVATLYSAQKKFHPALFHARKAASGRRTRFEVRAHLAGILVELGEFKEALELIDSLDESYRIGTLRHDVRVGLRCKLNLRMRNWKAAEQLWHELHVKDLPVHQALRAEILRQKMDDHTTTPGQRAAAEEELESLGVQQLLFGLFESPDIDSGVDDEEESS